MKVLLLALVGFPLWGQDGASQTSYRLSPAAPLTNVHAKFVQSATATDYNWVAQHPGGTMTGGISKTVTMSPCPVGIVVSGTYATPIYISGGSGTAESVHGTSGTCTSGASTGTVIFTPANSHSGSWSISSSTAGIYEAIAANAFKKIYMPSGIYTMRDCMALNPANSLVLYGDTADPSGTSGTFLNFSSVTGGCNAISLINTGGSVLNEITFRDFAMSGTSTTSGGDGIYLQNVVRVAVEGVQITGFAKNALETLGAFELRIDEGCAFSNNGQWGIYILNTGNLVTIRDSYFTFNSRSNNFGNISIQSQVFNTNQNQVVELRGNDIEAAGQNPFTSVATAYGVLFEDNINIEMANNYLENNLSQPVFYRGTNYSIFEHGNFFGQIASLPSNVIYSSGTQNLFSALNTFNGANSYRTFQGTDLSTFTIGPDFCESTSTECATHPHMLGSVSALSTTGAFSAAIAPNYIGTESGANNAIIVALLDQSGSAVPLAAGLQFKVKLAHSLQAGANTVTFNGTTKNIRSHINTANNISSAYSVGGIITLTYDGTQCLDESQ